VAIDLFASARATALVTLVAASFSSPILLKSDAAAAFADRLPGRDGGHAVKPVEPPQDLIAGGVQFELPAEWGRLGASAASADQDAGADRISSVVSGVCPGGSTGGDCKGDSKVTFLAYTGKGSSSLPQLATLEGRLDDQLAASYRGFRKGEAKMRPGADGIRYLDYTFTWARAGKRHDQRLAAYRHADGSGVVALVSGSSTGEHAEGVDEFLASAHDPISAADAS
jgi:hypothetical protein